MTTNKWRFTCKFHLIAIIIIIIIINIIIKW